MDEQIGMFFDAAHGMIDAIKAENAFIESVVVFGFDEAKDENSEVFFHIVDGSMMSCVGGLLAVLHGEPERNGGMKRLEEFCGNLHFNFLYDVVGILVVGTNVETGKEFHDFQYKGSYYKALACCDDIRRVYSLSKTKIDLLDDSEGDEGGGESSENNDLPWED